MLIVTCRPHEEEDEEEEEEEEENPIMGRMDQSTAFFTEKQIKSGTEILSMKTYVFLSRVVGSPHDEHIPGGWVLPQ